MDRNLTLLGGLLLVGGLVAIGGGIEDLETYGSVLLPLGVVLVTGGLAGLTFGLLRPDPRETTVRGLFGNEEENLLAKAERERALGPVDRRYLPSPRESVHCATCYTLIPSQELTCARCGSARRCERCGKRLHLLAGAVRCAPCAKDEVYCDCPRASAPAVGPRRSGPRR